MASPLHHAISLLSAALTCVHPPLKLQVKARPTAGHRRTEPLLESALCQKGSSMSMVVFFFFFTWRGFVLDHVLWLGAEAQSELHGRWCRGWGIISTCITPQEDVNVGQFKPAVSNHWVMGQEWSKNHLVLCQTALLKKLHDYVYMCLSAGCLLRNVNIYDCLSAESALF